MKLVHGLTIGSKFVLRYVQNKLGFYRPYFAQWEILYRCNMKCVFCNVYKDPTYDQTEIPLAGAFKVLEELKEAGVIFLNFTGGEPFLKKDFVEILHRARQLGFFITANTNGLLLPQFAPIIKDNVDSLHISLDSAQADQYEALRGVENSFEKVLEGIEAAKKQGIHVAVNLTANKKNFEGLRDFCLFTQKLRVDVFLTLVSIIPTEFKDSSESKSLKIDLKTYARRVRNLKKEFPFIKTSDSYLNFVENGGFNHYRCLTMKTTINIKPDGSMAFPCGYFPKFKFQGPATKLQEWPLFKEATKIFRYDFCSDCTLSCYFAPSALMDPRCWASMIKSYLIAGLIRHQ